MEGNRSLLVLGLILILIELTTPTSTPAPTSQPAPSEEAPGNSTAEASNSSAASKCKSTEILSENGCVDRDIFLNKIVMRSWKDEGFEKAKARAGLVDKMECRDGEVRTPFGCSMPQYPPRRESSRVPIHHSRLNGERIVHDKGIFKLYHHVDDVEQKPIRKPRSAGPPITGNKRPRKYVFLPGRSIGKGHKCRANEVTGTRSRCIQRKRLAVQRQHQTNENEQSQ
ncbi:uncharacterized protein LOC117144229 [Drosophila mauritiana]|uniref:Uncharacterized protein LOC117144229 n=1 Tax=Drosophila mauritiana TaxID=7226 RepID=A0A6P8K8B5_DROMA|nr:uncharacterized protein LOC117144229 [Drosophila mauritiana]